ncbi:hypothetical protein AK812_SmicGene45757, partial [Symbiodinium microadriaticum]
MMLACCDDGSDKASRVYGVPMEYEEACEVVYGQPYSVWKKTHQKKASQEQLSVFESAKEMHAKTEPKILLVGQIFAGILFPSTTSEASCNEPLLRRRRGAMTLVGQ